MYVWLEQSEVIQIKTKKYTVFMNNKDKDQTTAWWTGRMCIGISVRGSEKEIKQKRSRKDIRRNYR